MNKSDDFEEEMKTMDETQKFIFTPEFNEYIRNFYLFDDKDFNKECDKLSRKISKQINGCPISAVINVLTFYLSKLVSDYYDITETKTLKLKEG